MLVYVLHRDDRTRENYFVGWQAVSAKIIAARRRAKIRYWLHHRLLERGPDSETRVQGHSTSAETNASRHVSNVTAKIYLC